MNDKEALEQCAYLSGCLQALLVVTIDRTLKSPLDVPEWAMEFTGSCEEAAQACLSYWELSLEQENTLGEGYDNILKIIVEAFKVAQRLHKERLDERRTED